MFRTLWGYKSRAVNWEVNLPGREDTVIKQAVPPGGDLGIALCRVEACDLPKRGRLGCVIFGRGGTAFAHPPPLCIGKNQTLQINKSSLFKLTQFSPAEQCPVQNPNLFHSLILSHLWLACPLLCTFCPSTLLLNNPDLAHCHAHFCCKFAHHQLFLELTTWH